MRTNFSIINDGEKGRNIEVKKSAYSTIVGVDLLVDGGLFISIYRDDTYTIHSGACMNLSTHDLSGVIAALAEVGYDVVKRPDAAEASEKEE